MNPNRRLSLPGRDACRRQPREVLAGASFKCADRKSEANMILSFATVTPAYPAVAKSFHRSVRGCIRADAAIRQVS